MSFFKSLSEAFFNTFRFMAGPNLQNMQVQQGQKSATYSNAEKVAAKLKELDDLREAREGSWGDTQLFRS